MCSLTDAPLRLLRQTWPVWRSPEAAQLQVRMPPTVGTEIRSPVWPPHQLRLFFDASQTLFTLSATARPQQEPSWHFQRKIALQKGYWVGIELLIIRGDRNYFRVRGRFQGTDWTTWTELTQLQKYKKRKKEKRKKRCHWRRSVRMNEPLVQFLKKFHLVIFCIFTYRYIFA